MGPLSPPGRDGAVARRVEGCHRRAGGGPAVGHRRRRRCRPPLHERHHGGPQGGRPPPPAPELVRDRFGGVRRRRRGRRHPRERSALPRCRRRQRRVERVRRPAPRVPPGLLAGGLAGDCAPREHHPRHDRPHHAGSGGRPAGGRSPGGCADPSLARLRRRPHAHHGAGAGTGRLPGHGVRERLRPHGDQLHHRRPRPRRSPDEEPAGLRRPPGAGHRGRHPRRGDLGAGRAGVGGVPRSQRRRRCRRLVCHPGSRVGGRGGLPLHRGAL